MHKYLFFIVFLLAFLSSVSAQEEIDNYNNYSSLDLAFTLQSGINILPTSGQQKIEYIQADLSFFPRNTPWQTVSNLQATANPPAKTTESEKYLTYKWAKPSIGSLSFGVTADVKTKLDLAKIRTQISFPIKNLDNSLLEYTKPTNFIDLNPAIEQQAYTIIGAETDFYKVVFKLADWTKNNIKYDLNTLTAEAVQKSSWVLQNREGVCDEMTNLFISLLRSVGIPARFVSGMVYTNIDYAWGPHGWAEVFFPGYGWIPFDVTFGQYGWLDPSHIKLKESLDSGSPSAEYSWLANGVEVKLAELQPAVKLMKTGSSVTSPVTMMIEPLRQNVGPGSFIPILVTVTNKENYYLSTSLSMRKAPELVGSNNKEVLLLPGETKTIGWIASIPENIEKNYVYTSALEVISAFDNAATAKIIYAAEYPVFSRKDADAVLSNLEKREEKKQLTTLTITCNSKQEMYYANETALIECTVKNTATIAEQVDVCARTECQKITLNSGEQKQLEFDVTLHASGRIPITAETEQGVVSTYVSITTVALPELYITNLNPETVTYADEVKIAFDVNADSPVKNVVADFSFSKLNLESFQGSRQITIDTDGKTLYMKGLRFTMLFIDEKGQQHTQNIAIPLTITEVPWYAKIVKWVYHIF